MLICLRAIVLFLHVILTKKGGFIRRAERPTSYGVVESFYEYASFVEPPQDELYVWRYCTVRGRMLAGDIMNSRNLADFAEISIFSSLGLPLYSWHSPTLVREIDIRVRWDFQLHHYCELQGICP